MLMCRFDIIASGCIPVIINDDLIVPFPHLPWHRFSLRFPATMLTDEQPVQLTLTRTHRRTGQMSHVVDDNEKEKEKEKKIEYYREPTFIRHLMSLTPMQILTMQIALFSVRDAFLFNLNSAEGYRPHDGDAMTGFLDELTLRQTYAKTCDYIFSPPVF